MPRSFTFLINGIAGKPGKIASLDGIRAVAIILVLFRHSYISYAGLFEDSVDLGEDSLAAIILLNGWSGVDLFFVLSGFLIGYHLLQSWPSNGLNVRYLMKYLAKRALRTFPLYYFSIAVVLLGLFPGVSYTGGDLSGELATHLLFMQDYRGTELLAPLWSLATEEKFYLLCPVVVFVLLLVSRYRRFVLASLILLSMVPFFLRLVSLDDFSPGSYSEYFWTVRAPFHMALDGFVWGLLAAFLYHWRVFSFWFSKHSLSIFLFSSSLILILLSMSNWMDQLSWKSTSLAIYLFSLSFGLFLYSAIYSQGAVWSLLSSTCLRIMSRLSYSLYLGHMLVLPTAEWLFRYLFSADMFVDVYMIGFGVFFIVFIFLSLLIAVFMHILIERPFLKVKDAISLTQNSNLSSIRPDNK